LFIFFSSCFLFFVSIVFFYSDFAEIYWAFLFFFLSLYHTFFLFLIRRDLLLNPNNIILLFDLRIWAIHDRVIDLGCFFFFVSFLRVICYKLGNLWSLTQPIFLFRNKPPCFIISFLPIVFSFLNDFFLFFLSFFFSFFLCFCFYPLFFFVFFCFCFFSVFFLCFSTPGKLSFALVQSADHFIFFPKQNFKGKVFINPTHFHLEI